MRNLFNDEEIFDEEEHKEIKLYDFDLSHEDNFSDGFSEKYILFNVNKSGNVFVEEQKNILPNPQSKCVVNIQDMEESQTIIIDYESLFGIRLLSFIEYDSNFFSCDERVFFEAIIIKFKGFDFKPFYWSKQTIFDELGIKKDRADKIINKLVNLGLISTQLVTRNSNGRPQQVIYFDLKVLKLIELLPKIFKNYESRNIVHDIKKYLYPAIKKVS